jgi:hypothetical protein
VRALRDFGTLSQAVVGRVVSAGSGRIRVVA